MNDNEKSTMPPGSQGEVEANVRRIVEMEEAYEEELPPLQRAMEAVGGFAGTGYFLMLNVSLLAVWILLNTSPASPTGKFDPYPFGLLSIVLTVEAVLMTTFVLSKQTRMQRRSEHRNHLNLQIDLLAEKEITKILQLQVLICARLGIKEAAADEEVQEMQEITSLDHMAEHVRENLPPS